MRTVFGSRFTAQFIETPDLLKKVLERSCPMAGRANYLKISWSQIIENIIVEKKHVELNSWDREINYLPARAFVSRWFRAWASDAQMRYKISFARKARCGTSNNTRNPRRLARQRNSIHNWWHIPITNIFHRQSFCNRHHCPVTVWINGSNIMVMWGRLVSLWCEADKRISVWFISNVIQYDVFRSDRLLFKYLGFGLRFCGVAWIIWSNTAG